MKKILADRSFRLSIIISLIFLSTGFIFLHLGWTGYGLLVFVVLPVVLGISIGALPHWKWAYYGGLTGLGIFLLLLLTGQLEGFICVLMALPIIIPCLFLGSIISHLLKRYEAIKATDNFASLLIPLAFFLFGTVLESSFTSNDEIRIDVKTEVLFPYTSMQVYDAIKSVDSVYGEKPLLMKIDLPIPYKCVLEKEAVGGLRTCYFKGGNIVQEITELEKGKRMKMKILDYQLTGRDWLGFEEASYTFEQISPGTCKMTRVTTYTSELRPRFYWQFFEKMGVEQEHEYVFNYLRNELKRRHGQ